MDFFVSCSIQNTQGCSRWLLLEWKFEPQQIGGRQESSECYVMLCARVCDVIQPIVLM